MTRRLNHLHRLFNMRSNHEELVFANPLSKHTCHYKQPLLTYQLRISTTSGRTCLQGGEPTVAIPKWNSRLLMFQITEQWNKQEKSQIQLRVDEPNKCDKLGKAREHPAVIQTDTGRRRKPDRNDITETTRATDRKLTFLKALGLGTFDTRFFQNVKKTIFSKEFQKKKIHRCSDPLDTLNRYIAL